MKNKSTFFISMMKQEWYKNQLRSTYSIQLLKNSFITCIFATMQNKKTKVIISVINDLVTDQRVNKVSQTLYNEGYKVLLVGRKLPKSPPLTKRDYQIKRLKLLFTKGPLFYAEMNIRLFLFLIFNNFDIALSNDLDTLPANYLAANLKKKKLVYDSHEIFTEVPELINRNLIKKTWELIEKLILPKIKYSFTVNKSVAEYYKLKYHIKMQVVRNVPLCKNIETTNINHNLHNKEKIILYQGSLNIGRGLELMIKSMQFIKSARLMIIGDGDIKKELTQLSNQLNLNNKVEFLGRIPFEKLHSYTQKADLGISLEEDLGLNYKYSLPNKIFDYIHAGIPVLVSDLPEMSELILKYNLGKILKNRNVKELAKTVNLIFENNKMYAIWKQNVLKAKKELCWEQEEKVLILLLNSINL